MATGQAGISSNVGTVNNAAAITLENTGEAAIAPDNVTTDGEFDVVQFNKRFEQALRVEREKRNLLERKRLDKLGTSIKDRPIHELTIGEILFNVKDTIFSILDELVYFKFDSMKTFYAIFTRQKRLFYLGLLIFFLAMSALLFQYFFTKEDPKTTVKSHVYNSYNEYKQVSPKKRLRMLRYDRS